MSGPLQRVTASSPGRIWLFGHRQDYLNRRVIPCAISLRITPDAVPRTDKIIQLHLPDISSSRSFSLESAHLYESNKDYFRSCVKVLMDRGRTFSRGIDCTV